MHKTYNFRVLKFLQVINFMQLSVGQIPHFFLDKIMSAVKTDIYREKDR